MGIFVLALSYSVICVRLFDSRLIRFGRCGVFSIGVGEESLESRVIDADPINRRAMPDPPSAIEFVRCCNIGVLHVGSFELCAVSTWKFFC